MSGIAIFFLGSTLPAQQPFTLQQVLSAPYALSLTAAPVGARFAWVENAEGVRNIWVGSPNEPARQITHYTQDDAQDISNLTWSPDAFAIAYTYGAENGADGHPANPAHLQGPSVLQVIIQPLDTKSAPIVIGEGHSPQFLRDGCGILFLRSGKIWGRGFKDVARPTSLATQEPPGFGLSNGVLDLPLCDKMSGAYQLVFDRGSASQLTLSPDGNILAFISQRPTVGGPSHSFLALYDLRALTLTFPASSTGNDSAPTFSPDGKSIAWLRAPFTRQPEYTPHLTSPNPWSIQLLDLPPTERHLDRSSTASSSSEVERSPHFASSRTIFSPEPNKPGSVLPHTATGSPYLLWAARNRIVFYGEMDGWVHLYSIDALASNSKPTLLTHGKGEVEDVSLSIDRHQVFWTSNIAQNVFSYGGPSNCFGPDMVLQSADIERRHLSSLDLANPPSTKPNPFEDDFVRMTTGEGIETHPVQLSDGSVVALASDSFMPMHPVFVERGAANKDVRKDWLPKSYPQNDLVFPEEISFSSVSTNARNLQPRSKTSALNKQQIHAQLFLPGATKVSPDKWEPSCNGHRNTPPEKHPQRHPAIIFVHGGPNRQMLLGYPGMDYYSNAYAMNQYLASRDFIVLSVNYRGGIGYGLNFREAANYGPDGASEYNDVLAAQKYLVSRADVDPARIGIWGGSYGGYLTALALARNSNLFAAGVDFHGVHEWSLEGNPERWMTDPAHATAAQRDTAAALAHASSPMADIDKWHSPVLLIHGDNDPEVAYAQTPTLADALRARYVPVEELIFPDEVHGFLLHKDWLAAYQAAADFFARTLKP